MNTRRWLAACLLILALGALTGCFLFGNREPEAAFSVGYGVDPMDTLVVELDASDSTDPDGDELVAYSWVFGDDVTILPTQDYTSTVAVPVLRIRLPVEGTYTVTLVVRDSAGASSLPASATVTVPNVPISPTE